MKASDFLQLATLTIVIAIALILTPLHIQAKQGRHDKGTIFSFHFDEAKGKTPKIFQAMKTMQNSVEIKNRNG